MPTSLHLVADARTHTGNTRHTNQDAWGFAAEAGVFAVCDGMGGAAGGEVASRIAIEVFLEHMSVLPPEKRTRKKLEQAVRAANRRVHGRADQERALEGMGTTLVALAMRSDREWLLTHVGDSRCYLWRGGVLSRRTDDHSLVAEQVRMGVLSAAEAEISPLRNMITRAIGTRRSVTPDIQTLMTEPGDLLLLCSDGLTREVGEAEIATLLGTHAASPQACNAALVEAALAAGGRDNVTCLIVAVS